MNTSKMPSVSRFTSIWFLSLCLIFVIIFLANFTKSSVSAKPNKQSSTGFNYPNFGDTINTTDLKFVNYAKTVNDSLRLTPASSVKKGAVWHKTKQNVQDRFETIFTFRITNPGGISAEKGADGLAFVIQNSGGGAIGGLGNNIGYQGIRNSLAIEFDTFFNNRPPHSWDRDDPNENHIAVQTCGTGTNSSWHNECTLDITEIDSDMSDGNVHTVKIVYTSGNLEVFLNDMTSAVLSAEVDLSSKLDLDDGTAWVGFTSATGDAWENHDILSWSWLSGGDESLPDLLVDHIEVSQVFLANTDENVEPNEEIPLIAQKLTLVRVYVGVSGADSVNGVTARLYVQDTQDQIHTFEETYGVRYIKAKTNLNPYHPNLNDTINFRIRNVLTGNIKFWAEVDPHKQVSERNEYNNTGGHIQKTFQTAQTLRVNYIPLNYWPVVSWPFADACTLVYLPGRPSDRIHKTHFWAQRFYPTAHVEVKKLDTMNVFKPLLELQGGNCNKKIWENIGQLFGALTDWNRRNGEDSSPYVFGWIKKGAYLGGESVSHFERDSNTGQIIRYLGGPAFGEDHPVRGPRTFAHEIAHLLGRPHTSATVDAGPDNCGNPGTKLPPDWPEEYESAKIQQDGLDINVNQLSRVVKNRNVTYDYMSYCEQDNPSHVWISPWNYSRIYDQLRDEVANLTNEATLNPQPYFLAGGLVYTDATATLDPIWTNYCNQHTP